MVETESSNVTELDLEEVEGVGNLIGSSNYRFSRIGEPLPILDVDSEFDPQNPPSRPLAVSQRFQVLFVAHSTGFCVARTKDVMKSAEGMKNEANGSSIRELCVVDVPLGKVSILALSAKSSTLAASVGSHLHFFPVTSLLNKEQKPCFSFPLNDSSNIKDLRWSPNLDNHYLVLSSNGKLFHGAGQDDAKDVMDEVDAFDWSIEGKFIAVARNNVLCIMSSKFNEKLRIRLSFKSLLGDSDETCVVKVDSVRWVRPDSIVLGCYQMTDDIMENYLVQVISCKHGKITDASSSPVVLSFSDDVFTCLSDSAVPFGSGPALCMSYLDKCELAFTANQKNMDQHIVLFSWATEDKNEVAVIEILNDSWLPRIDSQGNGDDNMILGLCLDEVSFDENVKFLCGEVDKEVSPCCIVLCVTIDGKLSIFHFASAADFSISPEVAYLSDDEENNNHPVGPTMPSLSITNDRKGIDGTHFGVKSDELEVNQVNKKRGDETPINKIQEHSEARPVSGSFSGQLSNDISNKTLHGVPQKQSREAGTGLSEPIGSTTPYSNFSGFRSSEVLTSSKPSNEKPSSVLNVGLTGNRSADGLTTTNFAVGQLHSSYVSKTGGPSNPAGQLGMRPQLHENITMRKSSDFKFQSDTSNQRTHPPTELLNSEPNLSKQIHSVEEMAKELDKLLECIEGPGGFNDASVTLQKTSVASLEQGIWALSNRCRAWMELIDQRLEEIELLPDKMVQVLARKNYMEGIVKQATDNQYLDLWNRQKLSSELEIKHRHILEVNQNLTNQLIELERHLNTLELNKFGERNGLELNRRSTQKNGPPRHIQSLHSLHNTMSAQLVAAEQLSEHLSKQMAVLGVDSSPLRKQNIRNEVFEAIGISHDDAPYSPPDKEKAGSISSRKELLLSKSRSTINQSSSLKNSEPETARRRRDSLGQSWASFEPPKTTVKRMLLQEDHQGSPNRVSSSSAKPQLNAKLQDGSALSRANQVHASTVSQSSKSKGNQETPIKQASGSPLYSSFQFANYGPNISKPLGNSAFSSGSTSNNTSQNPARDSPMTAERSRNHLIPSEKSVSLTSNNSIFSQQHESYQYLDQSSSIPRRMTSSIKSKDIPDSGNKETVLPKSVTVNGNQSPVIADNSYSPFRTNMNPSFPTIPNTGSSSLFSGFNSQSETSNSANHLDKVKPFPTTTSLSLPAISLATPSLITPSSSSFTTPSKLSTSSGIKVDEVSLPLSSAPSPIFHSTTTSLATAQLVPSSVAPKTEKKMDDNSIPQASVPKLISKLDEKVVSPPKSMFPVDTSTSRFEPSVQSGPSNDPSASGSRLSFSITTTSAMNFSLNTKPEQQQQQASQPSTISGSSTGDGGKNNIDNAFTQEDEMEEEVPETSQLSLGSFSGFGIGSSPNSSVPKPHPFGAPFGAQSANPISTFPMTAPTGGGLFRPASFNIQSPQLSQPPQQTNLSGFSGGFSDQTNTGKVFGQPAQIGSGQQALGSVLGAFGQSRQLGTGLPGNMASASAFGSGFGSNQSVGGFSSTGTGGGFVGAPSTGGGFASLASAGGGFSGAAATAGGGFAAAPSTGGGFASMTSAGGGFGGAGAMAPAGGGFAAAASGVGGFAGAVSASGFPAAGGFGAFSNQGGGSGGFSTFGSGGGTGRPPSELFTQMRK